MKDVINIKVHDLIKRNLSNINTYCKTNFSVIKSHDSIKIMACDI